MLLVAYSSTFLFTVFAAMFPSMPAFIHFFANGSLLTPPDGSVGNYRYIYGLWPHTMRNK